MTILIRPKSSYTRKRRAGNGEEILKKLEDFLKNNSDEPIKILCRFWQDQQSAITYQELREAVVGGKLDENTFMEWSRDYSFLLNNEFKTILTTAIEAGSYSQPIIQTLNGYRFNNQTPAILNWIQQRGSELVTNCANEQKEAINLLLSKAVIENNSTEEIARYIRPCIGLTKGQAQTNLKYYNNIVNNLKEQHPKMKLESIQSKAREAAAKYAERQHRQRALTIAQTEMATAYNKGADESIRQAQAQHLIGTVKKRWSTSGDDAVCTRCGSLEGVEIDMYSKFAINARSTGEGLTPPAHPRCACAIEYVEVEKTISVESPVYYTGNREIDDAIDDFEATIVDSNGNDAMVTRLLLSHDKVNYVCNNKLDCAFMYNITKDVIMYNNQVEHWEEYDKIYALTHENAHRVDYLELKSWENNVFRQAIDTTSELVLNNKNVIKILLENDEYANDFAFNDLISGLTRGEFNDILFVGHGKEYYESDGLQAMEIFANLTCIDMSDSVIKKEFNGILKSLYDAYKEVVKWKG